MTTIIRNDGLTVKIEAGGAEYEEYFAALEMINSWANNRGDKPTTYFGSGPVELIPKPRQTTTNPTAIIIKRRGRKPGSKNKAKST